MTSRRNPKLITKEEYTYENVRDLMKKAQEELILRTEERIKTMVSSDERCAIFAMMDQCGIGSEFKGRGAMKQLIKKYEEENNEKEKDFIEKKVLFSIKYNCRRWAVEKTYHHICYLCQSVDHLVDECPVRIR